jgi:hypothetical protein
MPRPSVQLGGVRLDVPAPVNGHVFVGGGDEPEKQLGAGVV